jgi:hypothetical protein
MWCWADEPEAGQRAGANRFNSSVQLSTTFNCCELVAVPDAGAL